MPVQSKVSAKSEAAGSTQSKLAVGISPVSAVSSPQVADNMPQLAPTRVAGNAPKQSLFHRVRWFVLLVLVVLIFAIVVFLLNFTKSAGKNLPKAAVYTAPINVSDVVFPSDLQRDIFLKNFQEAAKTGDSTTRYTLLDDNYTRLLGFYTQDHDQNTRKVLEQYAAYMTGNYPDQAKKSIYIVPCYDSGCGKANYPDEIKSIREEINASKTIEKDLAENLGKNFEAAALSGSRETQFSYYEQVFQSLKGGYEKTGDNQLKGMAVKLRDFIRVSYGDLYNRYLKIKPDLFDI